MGNKQAKANYPKGEYFFMKQNQLDTGKENVVGGKQKVELMLSLKQDFTVLVDTNWCIVLYYCDDNKEFQKFGTPCFIYPETGTFNAIYKLDYFFEKSQQLKFVLSNNEHKEEITTTLGRIMGAMNNTAIFKTSLGVNLIVQGKAISDEVSNDVISFDIDLHMQYSGEFCLIISNFKLNNRLKYYKTNEQRGQELNFMIKDLPLFDLFEGNTDNKILLEVYDTDKGLICGGVTSLKDLQFNQKIDLADINKQVKGFCNIKYSIAKRYRFIEYIQAGLQMSLVCAIDFTGSNGHPLDYQSLHYIGGSEPNEYEQAIRSCGNIVAYYDYDQIFQVFGFGGIIPGYKDVSHCFNVTLTSDQNVAGVEGIITAYKNALSHVTFSGPTIFSVVIRNTINMVKSKLLTEKNIYYILLILTDGLINDMTETIDAICEAAKLPISIIIIGIGSEDFTNMKILDGDETPLINSKGEKVVRDIVQFVSFKDFKHNPQKLAEEVLYEIPTQVENYYRDTNSFIM
jgi:hypothetical protein